MKKLLNDGWEFCKMHEDSRAGEIPSDVWKPVDLPHDWLIWQSDDLYETADAWYRRKLKKPEAPVCMLRFDGVYMDCEVLVNGEVLCRHAYGYTAFDADLTGKLAEGDNEILVHIRHKSPNSRWYSGSGIYRDVFLVTLEAAHVVPDGLYVVTERLDGRKWRVRLRAETTGTPEDAFCFRLTDGSGRVYCENRAACIDGIANACFEADDIDSWSPEHPSLYTLEYGVNDLSEDCRIGFRTTRFDPDNGFFLNDCHIKLKGVCLHHDLGALGSAFHPKAAYRQLRLMKEMGVNAVRTSHNPPASAFLDLCDLMGILVIDEAFDMWERPKTTYDYARFFPEQEAEDVARWIRRDVRHPCVIMWSIGNEIYDMYADARGAELTRMLMEQVRSHDPGEHARVTFGSNYMPWEGAQRCAEIIGVPGYNYAERYYEKHHRLHPEWVIYGSETGSVLSSRGIYHFPMSQSIMCEADLQCSALGNSNTSWGAGDLREIIVNDLNTPYSMGQFIWSGIDYIGEPTPYRTRSCYFGQMDTACFPKDAYFLFKSLWTDIPMIHIGVSWDWNPGQMIDIPVMTNCAWAELFVNGQSCGRKPVSRMQKETCMPVWRIPFRPGEIVAKGYDEEENLRSTAVRRTPDDTAGLALTAEDDVLCGDGFDITFITIRAVDRKGFPVENARNRVNVRVSGGGRLLGLDNGDSTDTDGYKTDSRRLFGGKLLAIVGSDGSDGDVRIQVRSAGLPEREIRIPVASSVRREGTSSLMRIPDGPAGMELCPRKIEITPEGPTQLTRETPSCTVRWRILPEGAEHSTVVWQVTNSAGIETKGLVLEAVGNRITVKGTGDGSYYVRALSGCAGVEHPEIISQLEFTVEGMGKTAMNPYEFVSAGLYDLSEGRIGPGQEQGIAFARDGKSMVGFSNVDFGKAGTETLTLPVFALDSQPYDLEMYIGVPGKGGRLLTLLHYQKPSIWNTYQEETWRLPERLCGLQTICFSLDRKLHLKGFRFEPLEIDGLWFGAGTADEIYGDSFVRNGERVQQIGNNVTLGWKKLNLEGWQEAELTVRGSTGLELNAIHLQAVGASGRTVRSILNFTGPSSGEQRFPISLPGCITDVRFIFLPGSQFDFDAFRLTRLK